jgi:hypothetical protein
MLFEGPLKTSKMEVAQISKAFMNRKMVSIPAANTKVLIDTFV